MWLAVIEPEPYGQEKLVFECSWCRQEEAIVLSLMELPPPENFQHPGWSNSNY
jgi:hypothetical protein